MLPQHMLRSVVALAAALGAVVVLHLSVGRAAAPHAATSPGVRAAFGKLPLFFIENQGQLDKRVRYYLQGRETAVHFTSQGLTLSLNGGTDQRRSVIKLDFMAANPDVVLRGEDPTSAVISYFKGPREQWKTGVPTYASVVYRELWPGIDLEYSGTGDRLKYTFVVKPGADARQIRLAYRGATAVKVNDDGRLEVSTPATTFHDERPEAYQEIDGRRVPIAAPYAIARQTGERGHEYGFAVGAYDHSKPLVIDPAVIVYAGFIGGGGNDTEGYAIAADSQGNAYVTGFTRVTQLTFPEMVGPDLTYNGGFTDAFVAKVNETGTAFVYVGFIGGSGGESGNGIAVDASFNAYITGATDSTQATFPDTIGPDLTHNGGFDAFVVKVNAAGTDLDYAGFIGGSGDEGGNAIAVDSFGNAYVTGSTDSTPSTFPEYVGPVLTYSNGTDAFVARVNASGTALDYAGYIGGAFPDIGHGIAVDSLGNAYVTGHTYSSEATFPVTVGPDLTFNGGMGETDAFVAKVNAAGTALDYAGYIGGAAADYGYGIAVDASGHAYITGDTFSTENNGFPVAVGPDVSHNGSVDAFVAKVNDVGTALE